MFAEQPDLIVWRVFEVCNVFFKKQCY